PDATVEQSQQVNIPTILPTNIPATMVIPTPNQQFMGENQPESTATPIAIEIRSINVQTDEKADGVERENFRPIPTVDAASLNRGQNVFAATKTPVTLNIADQPAEPDMTRRELAAQIDLARNEIRNVTFVLEASRDTNAIDCQEVMRSYGQIFQNPAEGNIPVELALVYEKYDLALNTFAVNLVDLDSSCRAFKNDPNQQATHILVQSFEPASLVPNAILNSSTALQHVYDAQLWLIADEVKTQPLYTAFRDQLNSYGEFLNEATLQSCDEIVMQVERITDDVHLFSPPNGYRKIAYQHYLDAANLIDKSGNALVTSCQNASKGETQQEAGVFPAEAMSAAMSNYQSALNEIELAIAAKQDESQQAPALTPTPIPANASGNNAWSNNNSASTNSDSPISARLVRVQSTSATHLYEVVLQITLKADVGAAQVFIGGFRMDPKTKLLTITVLCDRHFQDRVVMIDGSGTTYKSNVVNAQRGDACPRYGTDNWPTATPHPTLTPKPQPTKFPTKTPMPTFTPWATATRNP
ncbi:MAG: hypothetical protein ACPG8W_25725, partial [Candidatus Promineifilaceae bacterium]